MVGKLEQNYWELRTQRMDPNRGDRLFPFSSHRKRMTTLIHGSVGGDADGQRVYSKGAAEIVLAGCKFQTKANGEGWFALPCLLSPRGWLLQEGGVVVVAVVVVVVVVMVVVVVVMVVVVVVVVMMVVVVVVVVVMVVMVVMVVVMVVVVVAVNE